MIFTSYRKGCKKFCRILLFLSLAVSVRSFSPAAHAQTAEMKLIEERAVSDILKKQVKDKKITSLLQSLRKDGTWPGINYKDTSRTGFGPRIHMDNLSLMAIAYRQKNNSFYRSRKLLTDFKKAFNHWLQKDYRCENWWWNEIGVPYSMSNILLLLQDKLTPQQLQKALVIAGRSNFDARGARPGGDFIKLAAIKAAVDLVNRDSAAFAYSVKTMARQVYIAEERGRGIKPDMSFHHRLDAVPSTLSYGRDFASFFAHWASLLRGTSYAFSEEKVELIIDFFLEGIQKARPFGLYDDPGIKNREISRSLSSLTEIEEGMANFLMKASDYRKDEIKHPVLTANRYFWYSHYQTHQRPSYFASVRMHSSRSKNIEYPYNEEGLKNHFLADGSQFITRTGKEYANIYPSWDWRKIPGTTVLQVEPFPDWKGMAKDGKTSFVGGVSDGLYGATAFDFISPYSDLKAHKSWFFFDDEIVCLGAGITTKAKFPVFTTLNQTRLSGPVWLNGALKKDTGAVKLKGPLWINHDSIGYIIINAPDVILRNGPSSGSWYSINHHDDSPQKPVTQNLFSLVIDHGVKPDNAAYSYIVLPAAGAQKTKKYAARPDVSIVANTDNIQAVCHAKLGIFYAVFYEAGSVRFPGGIELVSGQPALFMITKEAGAIKKIAVADPTRKLTKLTFTIKDNERINTKQTVQLPAGSLAGKSLLLNVGKDGRFLIR